MTSEFKFAFSDVNIAVFLTFLMKLTSPELHVLMTSQLSSVGCWWQEKQTGPRVDRGGRAVMYRGSYMSAPLVADIEDLT